MDGGHVLWISSGRLMLTELSGVCFVELAMRFISGGAPRGSLMGGRQR